MKSNENSLIARLPCKDRSRLLDQCRSVPLKFADVLSEDGSPPRHIYFPSNGFISLVTPMGGKPVLEVGMVGSEGMWGAQLALGRMPARSLHAVVQGQGRAWRLSSATFRRELSHSPALRRCVQSYLQVTMSQLATSAACIRFHQIGPRLARWLLMTQDRAGSAQFRVTHEFLAFMLGMRRVGITTAAAAMQRQGLIEYQRGELTVLSRQDLLAIACSCYESDRQVYAELLH
jgi:CRP-like cAMP-binding protein